MSRADTVSEHENVRSKKLCYSYYNIHNKPVRSGYYPEVKTIKSLSNRKGMTIASLNVNSSYILMN